MKLFEIVNRRVDLEKQKDALTQTFKQSLEKLDAEIKSLQRLENIDSQNIDVEKVQIAENILCIQGEVWNVCEGQKLTDLAIADIANGYPRLKQRYFGNKIYDQFYQRCDCEHGYGPSHGYIVERIDLKDEKRILTDDEKDACIYYLKNIQKIMEIK